MCRPGKALAEHPWPMHGTFCPEWTLPGDGTKYRGGKKAVWELWARLCKQMDEVGGWQEEGDCGKGSRARQCPCSSRNKMAREATPPPQGARLLLLMLTKIKNCIDRHKQTCPSPPA